ncbi:MAG: RelA/SpoT family protein [Bacteroidales bacterium]|nr:RelA/SpoT family protein [Bacteroidales bacterium]
MTEAEQITAKYEEIIAACKERRPLSTKEEDDITRAFHLARTAHEGTRRKSGEAYIFHPLAVALIAVKEVGLGPIAVICALLHDVVEDTEVTLDQIRILFGDRVALIVDGVTKIDSAAEHFQQNIPDEISVYDPKDSRQAENYRKILLAMCNDAYVIFLKLCDRLHNMRTLESMKDTKRLAISSETQYLYIPLAHRLGLYNIKTELEELVMRYTNPTMYKEIYDKIQASNGTGEKLKIYFTAPIRQALDRNGYRYEVKTRIKSVYSCWKKMQNKGVDFNEIYDLYAMRIILDTEDKAECFKVYRIITELFRPNPSRTRDWITQPKTNGYESLHTTVMSPLGRWVEVQIRTRQMDEVAEKGMAAHFLYKEAHPEEVPDPSKASVEDWLRQIRTSLENTEKSALDLVEEFKETLFTKEIYLFTPKGATYKLPSGSTVLDFAFAIHSELGLSCMGAKVNSKVVSPSYVLHSGEQVQVLTSRKIKPDETWLSMVRTQHAKESIKENLRKQKKDYRAQGERMLQEAGEHLGLKNNVETLVRIKRYFGTESDIDLYYRIAMGEITETSIAQCFGLRPKVHANLFSQTETPFLIDKDHEQLESYPAPCCKPIQGDEVVGILDGGKIAVHRSNCPNAMHEMSTHENRIVRAQWRKGEKVAFLTGISIIAIDRKGILQELTRVITEDMDLNMRAITLEASEGVGRGKVMLYVDNLSVLNSLIEKLQAIDGVERVTRI